MRKISFLAKNAIIGLKQGYEGFAIRGRLFVYAVSCSVQLCPVDQADDSHDQVNGSLRKVYSIKMNNIHPDRNDICDDPPHILFTEPKQFQDGCDNADVADKAALASPIENVFPGSIMESSC